MAALKAKPEDVLANYNLASCQMMNRDYAAAVQSLEAALRTNPNFVEGHITLASALSRLSGRASDAMREYEAVLKLRPTGDLARLAHIRLGMLLAEAGRKKEGIEHLETAQRSRPDPEVANALNRLRAANSADPETR
jgi:tetratricopeptide (TPR) repeat protein